MGMGLGISPGAAETEDLTGIDFYLQLSNSISPIVGDAGTYTHSGVGYGESIAQQVVDVVENSPRIMRGLRKGMMFEEGHAGSVVLHPRDFGGDYWFAQPDRINLVTLANNQHLLPDGTTAANVEIQENGVSGTKYIQTEKPVLAPNTKYFNFVFVKQGDTTEAVRSAYMAFHAEPRWQLDYTGVAMDFASESVVVVPLTSSGDFELGNPVEESGFVPYKDGWYLLWAIVTSGAAPLGSNFHCLYMLGNSPPTTANYSDFNFTSSCLWWGGGIIEADGFRSAPIANQALSVIPQDEDALNYPSSNYKQAFGSVDLDFYIDGVSASSKERVVFTYEGINDEITVLLDTNGELVVQIITAGVTRTQTTPEAITAGRHLLSFDFGNESGDTSDVVYLNAYVLALTTDVNTTAAPTPANIDGIYIGQDSTGNFLQGTADIIRTYGSRRGSGALRFATGGPEFIPTDETGSEFWYETGNLTLNEGDDVTLWEDQSGKGRDLTVPAADNPPLYREDSINGMPTVEFGLFGRKKLQTALFTLVPQPLHIFMVFHPFDWANASILFDLNSAVTAWFYQTGGAGDEPNVKVRFSNNTLINSDLVVGQDHIVEIILNDDASSIKADDKVAATGDSGPNGMDNFTLGGIYSGTNNAPIRVAEVVAYSSIKTGEARTNILTYLSDKTGIATN